MTRTRRLANAFDAKLNAKKTTLEDGRTLIFVCDVEKALRTADHEVTDADYNVYEAAAQSIGGSLNNRFNKSKLTVTRS